MIDGLQVNISDSYFTLHSTIPLLHPLSYWIWLKLRISFKGATYRDLVFVPTAKVSGSNQCPCIRLSLLQLLNQFSLHLHLHDSSKDGSWVLLAKRGHSAQTDTFKVITKYNRHTKLPLFDALFAGYIFSCMSFRKTDEDLTDPRLIEARHTCDYGR